MTTQSIVLPYERPANHIPRRDLVLGAADSLALEVSIVEWDSPSAPALELSGGLGGPMLSLFIWPWSCYRGSWDYGAPWSSPGSPLWSGDFTIDPNQVGTFLLTFPPGTMAAWPRRSCWSMQLAWDHSGQVSQLAWGNLHAMASGRRMVTPVIMLTDTSEPVLTDADRSAILVDGY